MALMLMIATSACSDREADDSDTSEQPAHLGQPAIGLSSFVRVTGPQPIIGISDNASGLTHDPRTGHLWLVINDPPELVSLNVEGVVLDRYPLPELEDVEGVTLLASNPDQTHLAVVQERRNRLTEIRLADGQIHIGADHELPDGGVSARLNRGPEGLAWMPSSGQIHIVKERSPTMLFIADLNQPDDRIRVQSCEPANQLEDWSGVSAIADSDHWLLLSDESSAILELDRDCQVIDGLPLNDPNDSEALVPQAEGVVLVGHSTLYLVSEPNLFYVYRRPSKP